MAVVLVAGVVVGAGPAVAAPGKLVAGNFRLARGGVSPVIAQLDKVLTRVSVASVVGSANRSGAACPAHAPARAASFCWESGDNTTTDWYPQGISSSADASTSGSYQGKSVIVNSWYWHPVLGAQKGDRMSFVDYSNPAAPRYRFVLLAQPYTDAGGHPDFKAEIGSDGLSLHAGGIAWFGHWLYVADTWGGFRVFDTDHIWKVATGDKSRVGRQSDGSYQAFDYAYVLPEAFRYGASTAGGYAKLRFSAVSVDQTGGAPSMVVPEYNLPGDGTHRVVRFPADAGTHLLAASSDGLVHGTEAYETNIPQMQGAASVKGKFYASTSHTTSTSGYGTLYTFGASSGPTAHANDLPRSPEDVSYWGPKDWLWSQTENPGGRVVYAMKAGSLP